VRPIKTVPRFRLAFPPDKFESEKQRQECYAQVFDNPMGLRVLQDIVLCLCGVGSDAYAVDARAEARTLGGQAVGLALLNILNAHSTDGDYNGRDGDGIDYP